MVTPRFGHSLVNDPKIQELLQGLISDNLGGGITGDPDGPPIPGMIAGFQTYGQPLRIGVAGVRKLDSTESLTVYDLVHIGSCTKAITAMLIGRLIEQDKLTLESTLQSVLPDLADQVQVGYRQVTLRQLLQHRGGIPRDAQWSGFSQHSMIQRRQLIAADALKLPSTLSVGEYAYSNLSYCLAGMFAEQLAADTWENLVQREIFQPLQMHSAGFGPPGTTGKIDQPWGHLPSGHKLLPTQIDNPAALGPAGTVHLTISDWFRFAFECIGCSDTPIVSAATRKLQYKLPETDKALDGTQRPNAYSGGWMFLERKWANGQVMTHSGSNTMWFATIWVAPNMKTVYVAVANAGSHDRITQSVDRAVGGLIKISQDRK